MKILGLRFQACLLEMKINVPTNVPTYIKKSKISNTYKKLNNKQTILSIISYLKKLITFNSYDCKYLFVYFIFELST